MEEYRSRVLECEFQDIMELTNDTAQSPVVQAEVNDEKIKN